MYSESLNYFLSQLKSTKNKRAKNNQRYVVQLENGIEISGTLDELQRFMDILDQQEDVKNASKKNKETNPELWHYSETKQDWVYLPECDTEYLKNIILAQVSKKLDKLKAKKSKLSPMEFLIELSEVVLANSDADDMDDVDADKEVDFEYVLEELGKRAND